MLSKLTAFVAGFSLAAALLISLVAFGQDEIRTRITPTVIDIQQSVPVLADIDGASVPITVDISLQVSLSGPVTVSAAAEAPAPVVAVATAKTATVGVEPLDYETVARNVQNHLGVPYAFRFESGLFSSDLYLLGSVLDTGRVMTLAKIHYDGTPTVLPNDILNVVAEPTDYKDGYIIFEAISIELAD